ncbi:unnamed protein product [Zymoseptoria tritici ST99CH_3D1]|nr:unnamed protein product [Zymoseptoria tritici ST99CH_3D1]
MEGPATPPRRTGGRVRTPGSPTHGAMNEEWEAYSPRRSTRSSLASNPYSSFNKSSRGEVHPPSDLASPPASPAARARPGAHNGAELKTPPSSDADEATTHHHSYTTTSSRTPKSSRKVSPTSSRKTKSRPNDMKTTPRIVRIQPADPSDVFPTRTQTHKQRKMDARRSLINGTSSRTTTATEGNVDVYVESNARKPEIDMSPDNVFYVPATRQRARGRTQQRVLSVSHTSDDASPSPVRRKPTANQVREAAEMDRAVANGEGTISIFRGRRIFHRYANISPPSGSDIGETVHQLSLKRAAGAAGDRPIRRSNVQPRLLFPPANHDEEAETERDDEEETDIEMSEAPIDEEVRFSMPATPAKIKSLAKHMPTPPTTGRMSTRKKWIDPFKLHEDDASSLQSASGALNFQLQSPVAVYNDATPEPTAEDGDNHAEAEHAALPTPASRRTVRVKDVAPMAMTPIMEEEAEGSGWSQPKNSSPFDSWQRTKTVRKTQQKREGEVLASETTKRTTRSTRNVVTAGPS